MPAVEHSEAARQRGVDRNVFPGEVGQRVNVVASALGEKSLVALYTGGLPVVPRNPVATASRLDLLTRVRARRLGGNHLAARIRIALMDVCR
jgi:hypothetical protein